MITPQAHIITDESQRNYRLGIRKTEFTFRHFKSYRELVKNMKSLIDENICEDGVYVLRTRRGEWGEWFEYWELVNGKPKIIRQGWN